MEGSRFDLEILASDFASMLQTKAGARHYKGGGTGGEPPGRPSAGSPDALACLRAAPRGTRGVHGPQSVWRGRHRGVPFDPTRRDGAKGPEGW